MENERLEKQSDVFVWKHMVNVKEKLAHTSEYYTNFFSVSLSNNIRISAEIAIALFAAVFIFFSEMFLEMTAT